MANSKTTALTAATDLQATDNIPGVQNVPTTPASRKMLGKLFTSWCGLPNGTYVSASSFTISGDYTPYIVKGTKLYLTNSTTKYFYSYTNSTYSGGNTTVSVTGGSDYSLTNTTISGVYFSNNAQEYGFPSWFNWSPTIGGFSANPTNTAYRFNIVNNWVTCLIRQNTEGTSNATTLTITLPVTPATVTNGVWNYASGIATNNSAALTTPALFVIFSGSATMQCFKDISTAAWTNSGTKRINGVVGYEI